MASQDTLDRLAASVNANTAAVQAASAALSELQQAVADLTTQINDLGTQVTALTAANATEDQLLGALATTLDNNTALLTQNTPAVAPPASPDVAP